MKWVSPNGPADLAGLLPGDHMLHVDGENVENETHQKVCRAIQCHITKLRLGPPLASSRQLSKQVLIESDWFTYC